MKRILLILTAAFALVFPVYRVLAATATPTAQPKTTGEKVQIDTLMERLATKVAELKQTQRLAIYGTVKPTGVASVTVETKTKNLKIELTDDIKVIQDVSGKRTALNTDDIDQGDSVVIFGEFDATLDLMRAKVI